MRIAALLLLSAMISGCASYTVSRKDTTMVNIENSGWYFLNFIPLASGNPACPNEFSTRLFSKTVTLENNIKMLDKIVEEEGAVAVRDLNSFTIDEHILLILFKRHSYHTSAQLLMYDEMTEPKAIGSSMIIQKTTTSR